MFSIQTPNHSHPYLTPCPFFAHDFQRWGCNVVSYPENTSQIKDIVVKHHSLELDRPRLKELWTREVVLREQVQQHNMTSQQDSRNERLSSILQDFIRAIAALGTSVPPIKINWMSPKCLISKHMPRSDNVCLEFALIYIRLLRNIYSRSNIRVPEDSNSGITIADRITLEFWPHWVKNEHLSHALSQVQTQAGRLVAGPRTIRETGAIEVHLYVDVGDFVASHGQREETVDPLPLYDDDEKPPDYVEG